MHYSLGKSVVKDTCCIESDLLYCSIAVYWCTIFLHAHHNGDFPFTFFVSSVQHPISALRSNFKIDPIGKASIVIIFMFEHNLKRWCGGSGFTKACLLLEVTIKFYSTVWQSKACVGIHVVNFCSLTYLTENLYKMFFSIQCFFTIFQ